LEIADFPDFCLLAESEIPQQQVGKGSALPFVGLKEETEDLLAR